MTSIGRTTSACSSWLADCSGSAEFIDFKATDWFYDNFLAFGTSQGGDVAAVMLADR
jgi:hypothetical protein